MLTSKVFICVCNADQVLFQIIKGRLYMDFKTSNRAMADVGTRGADGWFPGNEGAGAPDLQCCTTAVQIALCTRPAVRLVAGKDVQDCIVRQLGIDQLR